MLSSVMANWQITTDLLAELAGTRAALIVRAHAHELEVFVASRSPDNVHHAGETASLGVGRYCETVISTRRELLVPNALKDPNWDRNPDIERGIVSYYGLPISWPNGAIFGALCIVDSKENPYAPQIRQLVERLRDSIQWGLANDREFRLFRPQNEAAEAAMRDSDAQSWGLVDQIPVPLRHTDKDGVVLHLNARFSQVFGYTSADITTLDDWWARAHPDPAYRVCVRQAWDREVAEAIADGRAVRPVESRVTCKNGEVRTIETSGVAVGSGFVATFVDMTERVQIQEALRISEAVHTAFFENSMDAVILGYPDGTVFSANPAACALFGATEEQICALGRKTLIDQSDPRLWAYVKERNETGRSKTEVTMIKVDGTRFEADLRTSAYSDSTGRKMVCVVIRDLSERRQAEEEKAKLEGLLQQAQKMEAVGRLAGGVAHDFNNMLLVIIGHADLALKRVDPAQPLRSHLVAIREAAGRSADLTRQLLAFARKQNIVPRVLDLNEAVAGMLKMLQRLIGEDIQLQWQPGADLWPIKGDPSQIDQILANLCVNARDAIANVGRISIETGKSVFDAEYCAAHPGMQPGDYVRISVRDNGHGMNQDTLGHIFEPFYTTKETGKGTGLGLATVYGAVKQNNGLITVESEPGRGTTFTIYLPRYDGTAVQAYADGVQLPTAKGTEAILVVEDEPAILNLLREMLEANGYTVLVANTPGEALRVAREHTSEIRLLVTDVIMPGMNGRDLATKLAELRPNIKCLFMSGYTSDVIGHEGVLDGGVNFIQKPFTAAELTAKVRSALQAR